MELEKYIRDLIEKDELWRFYKTREWITLRDEVLKENHYECAICKSKGILTRYDIDKDGKKHLLSTVHHNQYVRSHPELALSKTYIYKGKERRNLIPICKACHNRVHSEKGFKARKKDGFENEERW